MQLLEGVRVVDFGREYVAAIVTQVLADFGAEVVKVEAPGRRPDPGRAGFLHVAPREEERRPRP
jgi:crotonobetainyl-CoA:carnitine CoA-transferase CaiB-like acyl-CoA transferase